MAAGNDISVYVLPGPPAGEATLDPAAATIAGTERPERLANHLGSWAGAVYVAEMAGVELRIDGVAAGDNAGTVLEAADIDDDRARELRLPLRPHVPRPRHARRRH